MYSVLKKSPDVQKLLLLVASYKIFQKHQLNARRFPVFPKAISNSRISRSCRHLSKLSATAVHTSI